MSQKDKLSRETIRKVARVARLDLTRSEEAKFSKDLETILGAFRIMQKAPTGKAKPSFHPVQLKERQRPDKVEECLSQEQALSNVKKNRERGYFRGPRAV
jgi:aspartyl-tRNA(Asn)/glutamyl-tRNA(Gln) amidotransferase subunit C